MQLPLTKKRVGSDAALSNVSKRARAVSLFSIMAQVSSHTSSAYSGVWDIARRESETKCGKYIIIIVNLWFISSYLRMRSRRINTVLARSPRALFVKNLRLKISRSEKRDH